MHPLLRNLALFGVSAVFLAAVGWALLRPQGLPVVREKYQEMKTLEQEVQSLREQVQRKRHEVEQLQKSDEARKRAVRQHLNKALPGETTIILPGAAESGAPEGAGR